MFNLIFGRGEESDYFWEHLLFPRCSEYFRIEQAIRHHSTQDSVEDILNKERINMNALFYALLHLIGLEIDPFKNTKENKSQKYEKGS